MSDGTRPQAVLVRTEAYLREQGNVGRLPAFVASVLRKDGATVTMNIVNETALAIWLQKIVPTLAEPSYRLLRGRDEADLQHELCALLNARLRVH
ncbi:MAG: hypothetical protein WKH97_02340 [Casimicrobiaceae bacterium]